MPEFNAANFIAFDIIFLTNLVGAQSIEGPAPTDLDICVKGADDAAAATPLLPNASADELLQQLQKGQRDPDASREDGARTLSRRGVLILPRTWGNVGALFVIMALAGVGCLHAWEVVFRKRCHCQLCQGNYTILRELGTGGFGTVFEVRTSSNDTFVLKKITVAGIDEANEAQLEAKQIRDLTHPLIVRYHEDFIHVQYATARVEPTYDVCIVMEKCCKDLSELIEEYKEEKLTIPEMTITRILGQVCVALQYCHNQKVLHLDIKSQNVFLTNGQDIRLGDFGLCRQLIGNGKSLTMAGTDCYLSPEMLLGKSIDGAADVWGLGLLVFELLTLGDMELDHSGMLGAQVIESPKVVDDMLEKVPSVYSNEIKKLVKRMLAPTASTRITVTELLSKKSIKHAIKTNPSRERSSSLASRSSTPSR